MSNKRDYLLSNGLYNLLREVNEVLVPGFIVMMGTIAVALEWNIEKAIIIVGAINIFFGLLLKVSRKSYDNSDDKYDLELEERPPDEENGMSNWGIDMDPIADADDLRKRDSLLVKVKPLPPEH